MHARAVLILDDEPGIRETLSEYLSDIGYATHCFWDTESALSALCGQHFDLAIVDVRLPGKDGHAFLRSALEVQPGLKAIIHTGSVEYMQQELDPSFRDSVLAVFIKPVMDMQTFVDVLQQLPET